jgi:hypothetical protein
MQVAIIFNRVRSEHQSATKLNSTMQKSKWGRDFLKLIEVAMMHGLIFSIGLYWFMATSMETREVTHLYTFYGNMDGKRYLNGYQYAFEMKFIRNTLSMVLKYEIEKRLICIKTIFLNLLIVKYIDNRRNM